MNIPPIPVDTYCVIFFVVLGISFLVFVLKLGISYNRSNYIQNEVDDNRLFLKQRGE